MLRKKMLQEHLNNLYITESIQKNIDKIKINGQKISNSLKTSNVLRIYKTIDFLKSNDINDLDLYAKKKFKAEYIESEKYIKKKKSKIPEKILNLLIIFRAGVYAIKNTSSDSEIQNETNKALQRIDKSINIIEKNSNEKGTKTIGVALGIQQLLLSSLFIGSILLLKGKFSVFGGCVLAALGLLIITFVDAKKSKNKVIN